MKIKNSRGSVLLMVTVFAMIFLVLAIATMKILLQADQDQSMDSEIARIRLFYAADGVSEIAMYAAAKNLMYDPRGQNPIGTAGITGTRRILTSYQMEGDIWPNVWSTPSGVHFDFSNLNLNAASAGVLVSSAGKQTANDTAAGVTHRYLSAPTAAAIALSLTDESLMPPDITGRQVLGSAGPFVYDVDFNVPYKSNANPMAGLGDNIRYRQAGGTNRQIWYMHLSTQNPNYVDTTDYTLSSFWCSYYPEMSPDNNILVRATMYQEFVLPPRFTGSVRNTTDPDLIGRGDGWPNVNVGARTQWPDTVRQFTTSENTFTDVNMTAQNWFYEDSPSFGNHYNGGNARRRFFVIIAEARFADQSAGGVFAETYKIETRFFIEDERTYGPGRQYDAYLASANFNGVAQANKPRVKFYFRSRIPRPI